MTASLLTMPSTTSLRLWMGTVPAASMSQLVNVFLPNWVDLAVRCSILRLCPDFVLIEEDQTGRNIRTHDGIAVTRILKKKCPSLANGERKG